MRSDLGSGAGAMARGAGVNLLGMGATTVVGFVFAFIASVVVVRPFLALVRRAGFVPFAWYRIAAGVVLLAALALGWL